MRRHLLFLLLVLSSDFVWSDDLFAQEKPPQPSPPFVADAPAVSGWKVTMTFKRGHPEPADKNSPEHAQWQKSSVAIAYLLVSKSAGHRRTVTQYVQGAQGESYRAGNYLYEHKPGYVAGDVSVNSHFKPDGDFPELAWLSLDNYKDVEVLNGKKYFVFREGADAASGREAWIDVVTKLPFKFSDVLYDRIYEFPLTPPIRVEPSEMIAKRAALDVPPK